MPNKQAVAQLLRTAIESEPTRTQASIAVELGVQAPTVNKWAQGKTLPTFDRWPQVEESLGLKPGAIEAAYRTPAADRIGTLESEVAELREDVGELTRALAEIKNLISDT